MTIRFDDAGGPRDAVLGALETMRAGDADWRNGRVPLYVFSGPPDVQEIGRQAFNLFFTENALGARRAFPSLQRMEQEIVGMGLDLFLAPDGAAGNMTSGGTESIVMAVKACRDWSRARRGDPSFRGTIVAPVTARPAFDKAAALMDLTVRRVPVTTDFRADVTGIAAAIDDNTMMLVGSAPCFPFGVIDPLAELSELALRYDVWLHSDACVGGWMAPFAADIGRGIPAFDFGLPGVCSLSADLQSTASVPSHPPWCSTARPNYRRTRRWCSMCGPAGVSRHKPWSARVRAARSLHPGRSCAIWAATGIVASHAR
jgi:sphinganine-1-phosphate aldolase